MALSAVALASARAASAAARAGANSTKVVSPSAKRSPTSTAWRLRSSVRNRQVSRQQAQASRRSLRSLALPRRDSSIAVGSVQANHSVPVTVVTPGFSQGQVDFQYIPEQTREPRAL